MTASRLNGATPPSHDSADHAITHQKPTVTKDLAAGEGIRGGEWTLAGGRPLQILRDLLDRPDAAKRVRQTPVQPLYLFIKALGLSDSRDLLKLCSTAQIQAFLDLDGWEGDRLSRDRLFPWIEALCTLGPSKLALHVAKLDAELMTTFLGPQLRIYELTDEEPPDDSVGQFLDTPDRFFRVDILPDPTGQGDRPALIGRFLEDLYRGDLELARVLLTSARWDLGAETEETAYRFRSGRLADLGFIEHYEALKVYMLVDPAKPPPAEPLTPVTKGKREQVVGEDEPRLLPDGLLGPGSAVWQGLLPGLGEQDFTFGQAISYLQPEEQARLLEQLLLLSNTVMSADRVEPADASATTQVLRRTAGYLSLGLDFRLRQTGKVQEARDAKTAGEVSAQVLREVSLRYLFRLGYSLTLQLRKLAVLLVQGGAVTLIPKEDIASLLPADQGEILHALLAVRPEYCSLLDSLAQTGAEVVPTVRKAADGTAAQQQLPPQTSRRAFRSLRDLSRAAAFLEKLGALDKLLTIGLGLRKETLVQTLTGKTPGVADTKLQDILGTMVGNHLLQRPPAFVPLSRQDLPELRLALLGPGEDQLQTVQAAVMAFLKERVEERSLGDAEMMLMWTPATQAWLSESIARLASGLQSLPVVLPPELLDAVLRVDGLVLR